MWIIYNLAHKFTKIRSSDGDAWIRVLGFFAKQEEAIKYAKKYAEYDNIEIRISPQNQFKVMMKYDYKNDQLMLLREKEVNKYYMLLDLHKEKRSHAFKETYDNAKNHQVGKLKNNDESQIDEDLAKVEEEVFAKENNSFSQLNESVKNVTMTIRMQNFCGIAVIPDYLHIEEENKEFEDWERKRLLFYSGLRNRLVHEKQYKLCVSSLMHDWVKKNVPPNNANIYGQKMTNPETEMFSKIPENTSHLKSLLEAKEFQDKNLKDSNFICWYNMFQQELDARIWNDLGINEETLNELYLEWSEKNVCPNGKEGAEPMVAFLHVSNTEEEMKKLIEEDNEFRNYDIGCIAMYEWVKLKNAWSGDIKKTYREKVVADLHNKLEYQKKQAELLKEKENVKLIEIQ